MRAWLNGLVYLSAIGVVVALYRADFLTIPVVRDPLAAAASLLALAAGFLATTLEWQRTLARVGCAVRFSTSLASTGLSVFGKYLPGKVWLLLARAAYVAAPGSTSLLTASAASVSSQLGSLWVALTLGVAGLTLLGGPLEWTVACVAVWAGISVFAFSPPAHGAALALARRVLRRPVDVPLLDLRDALALAPWFALTWLAWGLGFHLLTLALVEDPVPLANALAFPLAAAAGMLAIVLPGGIGAREGVLATCLALAGVAIPEATAVAVASRLWWLLGEIGVFVAGLVAHRGGGVDPASGKERGAAC